MRRFFASFYRITSRTGFLGVALILALFFWYLPSLLNFDAFRPRVTDVLETTFHCKVLIGGITGQLIPSPGFVIAPVVLLENAKVPRVLASASAVRLSLSAKPLLKGALEFKTIRFLRPRFIAHRVRELSGQPHWVMLSLPNAPSSKENGGIDAWQVRDGRTEIWDQTRTPTVKWVADHLSGTFLVRQQTGELGGTTQLFGHRARVDVHYSGAAPFPIQARLNGIEIGVLQYLLPMRFLTLAGQADLSIQIQFQPAMHILAQLNQPSGAGQVEASIQNHASGNWWWSVFGKHSRLKGTDFEVPEWSAKRDDQGVVVYVRGTSAGGGMAQVRWTKPATLHKTGGQASRKASLEVDVSSVTIRQVLEVFKLESKTPATRGASFNPYGYESWQISQGSVRALIHGTTSFEVQNSHIDVAGMHLDLTGSFELLKTNPQAHIQGQCLNIPVTSVVESFFSAPTPMTGTGTADFNLSFPLSVGWIKGLNGPVHAEVKGGVLKSFKTLYRIMAILNLGNYLQLRFPKITAKGIEFEDVSGDFKFQNGVLSTDDLFLKSPNMNIGLKGSLDIPGRQVKATLRLEMMRFLEDVLKNVPVTHWIFKKPNKIFMPLAVYVEGPWNDISIR